MKLYLFFFVLSVYLNAQFYKPLEENQNWKSYYSVKERHHYGNSNYWAEEYLLDKGNVSILRTYYDDTLRSEFKFYFDEFGNIVEEVEKYNVNKGIVSNVNQQYNYIFDSKNRIVEDGHSFYSDFTEQGKPQVQISKLYDEKLPKGFKKEISYDKNGRIAEVKVTKFLKGIKYLETETYKYDDCGNLIEIKRNAAPNKNYPILSIGGRNQYENEKFEYEYADDCIWQKKFWIINNKQHLLTEREFVKISEIQNAQKQKIVAEWKVVSVDNGYVYLNVKKDSVSTTKKFDEIYSNPVARQDEIAFVRTLTHSRFIFKENYEYVHYRFENKKNPIFRGVFELKEIDKLELKGKNRVGTEEVIKKAEYSFDNQQMIYKINTIGSMDNKPVVFTLERIN